MTRRTTSMQAAMVSSNSTSIPAIVSSQTSPSATGSNSATGQSSPSASQTSSGVPKPKVLRGKTTCRYLASLPRGTKLPLEFDHVHRPIGKYKSLFTSYQGVVVRNMEITPVNKKSWRGVSKDTKDAMVEALVEKFEVGEDPLRIAALKRQLGKKWRDFRASLKRKFYDPYNNDDDRIENRPMNVRIEEWKWLLTEYWGTEKIQDLCDKNSERRECQEMLHRTGRKSFAVIDDEEFQMTGEHPNRMKMFLLAYKGYAVDSREFIKTQQAAIDKLKSDRDEGLNELSDADIFDKVFGGDKYGRVLCRGSGVTPSMESRSSCTSERHMTEEAQKEIEKANNKCAELTLELQNTNDTIRAMKEQMDMMYQMMAMASSGQVSSGQVSGAVSGSPVFGGAVPGGHAFGGAMSGGNGAGFAGGQGFGGAVPSGAGFGGAVAFGGAMPAGNGAGFAGGQGFGGAVPSGAGFGGAVPGSNGQPFGGQAFGGGNGAGFGGFGAGFGAGFGGCGAAPVGQGFGGNGAVLGGQVSSVNGGQVSGVNGGQVSVERDAVNGNAEAMLEELHV